MEDWVHNELLVEGPTDQVEDFADRLTHGSSTELDFEAHLPTPAALSESEEKDWRRSHWGAETGAHQVTVERLPQGGTVFTFRTITSPPEQWLEAVAKTHRDLQFSLLYKDEQKRFAGRTGWSGGELTAYEWLDPQEPEEPEEVYPQLDVMAGPVVLRDRRTHAAPATFLLQVFGEWLEDLDGDGPDECALDFDLWLYEPINFEDPTQTMEILLGPVNQWDVLRLDAEVGAWLKDTFEKALQTATEHLDAELRDAELETRVQVSFFPADAVAYLERRDREG